MLKTDALAFYGAPDDPHAAANLARAIGIPRQNVYGWREVIPYGPARKLRDKSRSKIPFRAEDYEPSGKIRIPYSERVQA